MTMNKKILFLIGLMCQCWAVQAQHFSPVTWVENTGAALTIQPQIQVFGQSTIDYKRKGKSVLKVELSEPAIITVASKPEKWGYVQFPDITRTANGTITAKWNMADDAMEAYGHVTTPSAISTDGGKTWKQNPSRWEDSGAGEGVQLPNGDWIKIMTPPAIKDEELALPKPAGTVIRGKTAYTMYKISELPPNRQGVFLARRKKGERTGQAEQATLDDPQALRYSLRGMIPVVWWGDMKMAADGSVIAGVYPGYYLKNDGMPDPKGGTFFYRSTDSGRSWKILSRIPYQPDLRIDTSGHRHQGFTEPAFEILKDGTFLCVMRTTDRDYGPMYASHSTDAGKTWSKPQIITPNGVLPRLLQLKNGVTVVSAGRPGVQLRFSNDGKGETWTNAFDMLPYEKGESVSSERITCGYTGLLATGTDKFLVIYSDFAHKNEQGEIRKAIKVREIKVSPL